MFDMEVAADYLYLLMRVPDGTLQVLPQIYGNGKLVKTYEFTDSTFQEMAVSASGKTLYLIDGRNTRIMKMEL